MKIVPKSSIIILSLSSFYIYADNFSSKYINNYSNVYNEKKTVGNFNSNSLKHKSFLIGVVGENGIADFNHGLSAITLGDKIIDVNNDLHGVIVDSGATLSSSGDIFNIKINNQNNKFDTYGLSIAGTAKAIINASASNIDIKTTNDHIDPNNNRNQYQKGISILQGGEAKFTNNLDIINYSELPRQHVVGVFLDKTPHHQLQTDVEGVPEFIANDLSIDTKGKNQTAGVIITSGKFESGDTKIKSDVSDTDDYGYVDGIKITGNGYFSSKNLDLEVIGRNGTGNAIGINIEGKSKAIIDGNLNLNLSGSRNIAYGISGGGAVYLKGNNNIVVNGAKSVGSEWIYGSNFGRLYFSPDTTTNITINNNLDVTVDQIKGLKSTNFLGEKAQLNIEVNAQKK